MNNPWKPTVRQNYVKSSLWKYCAKLFFTISQECGALLNRMAEYSILHNLLGKVS